MGVALSPSYFVRSRLWPWLRARRDQLLRCDFSYSRAGLPRSRQHLPTNHRACGRDSTATVSAGSLVQLIRAKLADADIRKGANADDLAALEAFYAARTGGPLWVTEMGFSTKAQAALFEIEKADDWGLDAAAFELPGADALPVGPEERAVAEIKLDLAILKYARFARGGTGEPANSQPSLRSSTAFTRSEDGVGRHRRRRRAGSISSITPSQARAVHAPASGAAEGPRREGASLPRTRKRSAASSSTWSAGAGCRRPWAASMCGTIHRSSCCM